MPTRKEQGYYAMGYKDSMFSKPPKYWVSILEEVEGPFTPTFEDIPRRKPKRKLSAWNKFVKANSKKKIFRYRNGKLNLKKMGVAFRKKRR